MIWTLKVFLIMGFRTAAQWVRVIEIEESATLEDLHFAIQDAVDFDNDHLYEFYIARTWYSRNKVRFDEEDGAIYSKTLAELFPLPRDRKLFYMFDYGDSWTFNVSRTRKAPQQPLPGIEYPRIVEAIGANPEQYPSCDWC